MFFRDKNSQQITERAAELTLQLEQTRAAICAAENAAAEAVVQGAGANFAAVGTLKAQAAAMESALNILETEKLAALKRERLADAKQKRELAKQKRAEAAGIAGKTSKLLEKLGELEGIQFDGSILSAQRVGPWMRNLAVDARIPDGLRTPGEMIPDLGCHYAAPRERVLLGEAFELEDQAEAIEQAEGVETVAEVAG